MNSVRLALLLLLILMAGCARRIVPAPVEPARPVAVSAEAAKRLEQKVAQAFTQPGMVRLAVTEEEATSYLAHNLAITTVREATLWFTTGQVYLRATLDGDHTLRATLAFHIQHGMLQLAVPWATLDGRRLPRFLLASVEKAANDPLSDAQLPLKIEGLTVEEGALIIAGRME